MKSNKWRRRLLSASDQLWQELNQTVLCSPQGSDASQAPLLELQRHALANALNSHWGRVKSGLFWNSGPMFHQSRLCLFFFRRFLHIHYTSTLSCRDEAFRFKTWWNRFCLSLYLLGVIVLPFPLFIFSNVQRTHHVVFFFNCTLRE